MEVHVVVRAGVVASVPVRVEAIHCSESGWLVVLGYEHDMTPIYHVVHDRDVVEVEVEALCFATEDAELCAGELVDSDEEAA